MRSDRLYLCDMVEAATAIAEFVAEVRQEDFHRSELLKSAVLQKLIVIGEAAARLSEPFRASHPQIEWRDIANFRNIAVHAYFSIDWRIVWVAATTDAPELRQVVEAILAGEFAGEGE